MQQHEADLEAQHRFSTLALAGTDEPAEGAGVGPAMSVVLVLVAYAAALLALGIGLLLGNPHALWLALATGLLAPLAYVLKGLAGAFLTQEPQAQPSTLRVRADCAPLRTPCGTAGAGGSGTGS